MNLKPGQNPDRLARHVTIAISGFLSRDTDKVAEWQQLIDHLEHTGTSVYALSWESQTVWQTFSPLKINSTVGSIAGFAAGCFIPGGLFARILWRVVSTAVGYLVPSLDGSFSEAKANAKKAGTLLACQLALRDPFLTQSVSLVGFSLGCQVIKTCLKTLAQLNACDIIQNVTFLGAAIDIPDKPKTRVKMAGVFSKTVAGQIKNAFTESDMILITYMISNRDLAMGRNACFTRQFEDGKRMNLCAETGTDSNAKSKAVVEVGEPVFRL